MTRDKRHFGWMKKIITFVLITLSLLATLPASPQMNPPTPYRPDSSLLHFFRGSWHGEGAFANGKKIAADASFQVGLDSSWLVYTHRDRSPGPYQADAYWGEDRQTGEFLAYSFDNFQGHRQFVSPGWKDGRLVLTAHAWLPSVGSYFEHFIYEKLSATSFKMTYETSRDGIEWRMGDWLVFSKYYPN